jgi:hypothetical protein
MAIRVCPLCLAEFLDYKTSCTHCGVALVDPTEDVDIRLLEDDEQVVYELAEWPIDAQTDTAELFAECGIPHLWDGTDLIVPAVHEESADQLLERIEEKYGLVSDSDDDGTTNDSDSQGETEYELDGWDKARRMDLVERLVDAGIPHRWEDALLVVPTTNERKVDDILDEMDGIEPSEPSDIDPAEILNIMFLAAERMRKGKVDADQYASLLAALDAVEPDLPPYGVDRSLWSRAIECAEDLADAVAADSDELEGCADQLFGMLRELV